MEALNHGSQVGSVHWFTTSLNFTVSLKLAQFHPYGSYYVYEGVSKSFRTGRLERELHMVKLHATRCSCIAIL